MCSGRSLLPILIGDEMQFGRTSRLRSGHSIQFFGRRSAALEKHLPEATTEGLPHRCPTAMSKAHGVRSVSNVGNVSVNYRSCRLLPLVIFPAPMQAACMLGSSATNEL